MSTVKKLAEQVLHDLELKLPGMYKSPREKLSLCVGAILEARSCNTMEIANLLPIDTSLLETKYQWLNRFLSTQTVDERTVMNPFMEQAIKLSCNHGQTAIFMIDQTHIGKDHSILMISLKFGQRALPLCWLVKQGLGNMGFEDQKLLLDSIRERLLPFQKVLLLGDRFYGCEALIQYCHQHGWDYRLRLKGSIKIDTGLYECSLAELAQKSSEKGLFLNEVMLTNHLIQTNVGIIHESGHPEPWIIAMSCKANIETTKDYGCRWGIECLFSDFKSNGFGLEDTHLEKDFRVSRLLLILSIALHWSVITGYKDYEDHPTAREKKVLEEGYEAIQPTDTKLEQEHLPNFIKKVWRSSCSFFKRGLRKLLAAVQQVLCPPSLFVT